MAKSGSKIMKCELSLRFNGPPGQNVYFPCHKTGEIRKKCVQIVVNPGIHTQGGDEVKNHRLFLPRLKANAVNPLGLNRLLGLS